MSAKEQIEGAADNDHAALAQGNNKSGRTWKNTNKPLKPHSQVIKNKKLSSWELKKQQRLEDQQFKQKLKELKQEKEDEKQAHVQRIKERREMREEKERYERLALKMHAKKVERLKRREKRNKALKERFGSESRSVTPSEFIPSLKTPDLKLDLEDKRAFPQMKSHIQTVFALGHVQTAADLRANKDPKPVLCFSSGQNRSVFEMQYQSKIILKLECESKILKIVTPVLSEVALVYSDNFGLILENGNVIILKLLEACEEEALFVQASFQKSQFQSNPFVDVVFSPFDKNQAAFMDCVGNWCMVHLKHTGSILKLALLPNACGSIFDPEELDSVWRKVIWTKEHDKLLLFDETKIVSTSLNGNTDLLQLSENKTWSRIHDVVRVGDYIVILTTMEIQILHMNGSGLLSKAFSWKHYFDHQQSLELSTVICGDGNLFVGTHARNTSVLFLYQFRVTRNEPIKVSQLPVYVEFGKPLECFEMISGDLSPYFTEGRKGSSLHTAAVGVVFKLQDESKLCYMELDFNKGHSCFSTFDHEKTHFNLSIPQTSYNFLKYLDTKNGSDVLISPLHNTGDEVDKYEKYGLSLENHITKASAPAFVKSLIRFETPNFDVSDTDEFFSFVEQIGKHFDCKYAVTEITNLLANHSLKAKNADDTKALDVQYQSLLAEWSSDEVAASTDTLRMEHNSLNRTNAALRLQTEKQLPEIRLSQSSQPSSQKRKQEQVLQSQGLGNSWQSFSHATLPSSMPPGFSLSGSQQASQQTSRSQPSKKRKKRAKGFF
ncbi:hypothetical protein ACO0QE_002944 [Hanseniaspora vineae]